MCNVLVWLQIEQRQGAQKVLLQHKDCDKGRRAAVRVDHTAHATCTTVELQEG
jgi:hypothetical protein